MFRQEGVFFAAREAEQRMQQRAALSADKSPIALSLTKHSIARRPARPWRKNRGIGPASDFAWNLSFAGLVTACFDLILGQSLNNTRSDDLYTL
jgi:hypothetical protein